METLSILIMNWRDIRNPEAGGAEVFTHEVAKRFAEHGNEVSVFASEVPNCPREEMVDGVRIIRRGTALSVYRKGNEFLDNFGHDFDVIIEEVNTRPFFARPGRRSGASYLVVIHQLAREFWDAELPMPIAMIGRYLLEPVWLSRLRNEHVLVPSPSTRLDLSRLGFSRITEFRYGLSNQPLEKPQEKKGPPTFLFLGRLKSTKLPGDAIKAFLCVKKVMKDARMLVIGQGPLLERLSARYAMSGVEFLGARYGQEKLKFLRLAHLLLVPGIREGWGMVVTEANSMATPAIAYDVPGLRDSVQHQDTGILVRPGDYEAMASEAVSLLRDTRRYEYMRQRALEYSHGFAWEKTVRTLEEAIFDGRSRTSRQTAHFPDA